MMFVDDLTDCLCSSFNSGIGLKPTISIPSKPRNPVNVSSAAVPASCANTITPTCVQDLYGVPATKATSSSNKLGVAGFIDQFANNQDLQSFLTQQRPDLAGTTFALQTLDGGQNTQTLADAGIEADLDTQYTIGIASGVPVTFISCGERTNDGLGGFLDWANFVNNEAAPPQVVTTSYGQNENEVSSKLAK